MSWRRVKSLAPHWDSNLGLPLSCLFVPLLHGEMTLEISVTNRECWLKIEGVGNCLRFHCEHVLSGWKIYCIVNLWCFCGRKSFLAGNILEGQYVLIIWENVGTEFYKMLVEKLCKQSCLRQVSLYVISSVVHFILYCVLYSVYLKNCIVSWLMLSIVIAVHPGTNWS